MTTYRFRRYDNVRTYAHAVGPHLLSAEAENNVLLGLLRELVDSRNDDRIPVLLGAVETGDQVVGCAWRMPPKRLGITRIPDAAIECVVDSIKTLFPELDAVVGPGDVARQFGKCWTRRRNVAHRVGMQRGIYELSKVVSPRLIAPGKMVVADDADLPLIVEWGRGFRRDSKVVGVDPITLGRRRVQSRRMYLWVDGRPRSMAARVAETENGVRVGYVYTPPDQRGCGYASTLVATLSQAILDEGWQYCFLQADLTNPTSTGIYERLGYEMRAEVADILFEPKRE